MIIPKQFPFYPEHIPEELKAGRFWVCCDTEKVPMIAGEVYGASSTNPATWRTYEEVVAAVRGRPRRYAGVGRVIVHEDPYVGIDVDDVRDPATGEIPPAALALLRRLDSYSEVSPSGKGVKVWLRARLERSYVKPGLEVYQRGRYFTLTGQLLPQYPATIEERQEEVEELITEEFPSWRRGRASSTAAAYDGPEVELGPYLEHVEIFAELRDGLGIKYQILCPWVSEHSDQDPSGTYIGQLHTGALWFRCWHAHCHGRRWREFKNEIKRQLRRFTFAVERGGLNITVEVNERCDQ